MTMQRLTERSQTMKKKILAGIVMLLLLPATALAGSGYEGGFYVDNEEDTFRLTIGGRVQPALYYNKTKGSAATLAFGLRRALLSVNAKIHEKVSAGFSLMHTATTVNSTNQTFANMQVTGAYAQIEIIPLFVVAAGMVGLPLSMINEVSSKWYLVAEAPQVVTEDDTLQAITVLRSSFGTPDGLGLNFSGSYWKWFYSFSVISGNESNYVVNENSKRMSFGMRTGINILDPVGGSLTDFAHSATPKLTVSLGSDYQGRATDAGTGANVKYRWTSSLGVGLRWAGFAVTTEGFYRKSRITSLGTATWARPNLTDIGYYAALGYYFIPKKFEIAAQAGQSIRQGPANDSWELGGGLNYYIFDNNLKMQLTYRLSRFFDWQTTAATSYSRLNATHRVTLMTSAFF